MKTRASTVDATPSKRLYLSIIADYNVNKALCELVDNALDIWVKNGRKEHLIVDITLDQNQQRVHVVDNAGGLAESELSYVVGPGHTGNVGSDETIGIFGVYLSIWWTISTKAQPRLSLSSSDKRSRARSSLSSRSTWVSLMRGS